MTSFLPKAAAMVSLVKSSAVGPKPPVVMMISARFLAMSSAGAQPLGVVADNAVVKDVDALLAQPLGDDLRV